MRKQIYCSDKVYVRVKKASKRSPLKMENFNDEILIKGLTVIEKENEESRGKNFAAKLA